MTNIIIYITAPISGGIVGFIGVFVGALVMNVGTIMQPVSSITERRASLVRESLELTVFFMGMIIAALSIFAMVAVAIYVGNNLRAIFGCT